MRLSNRNKINYYSFLNSLLYFILFLGIFLYVLDVKKFNVLGPWYNFLLIIIPIVLLAIHQLRGRQIFEYDSDGEALNFKNRHVMPVLGRTANDEFPKYKLLKYDIVNMLVLKRLYVVISSKKSKSMTLVYDISYLTKKEVQDLRFSLNKVVKNNKENSIH